MERLVRGVVGEGKRVSHPNRTEGKWTSVTVTAEVKDKDTLYRIYERIDEDPRVKFKF